MHDFLKLSPYFAYDFRDTGTFLVSFAAVIRVVTQRSSPLAAVSGEERCVTTLITAAKETIANEARAVQSSYSQLGATHQDGFLLSLSLSFFL